MHEVRNSDGRLVCRMNEATSTIEIKLKNCTTRITFTTDGTAEVVHVKEAV